jgi:type 1 fimbriae regulatory protein FimB/type 1 fimbriae regulatory protein FimE
MEATIKAPNGNLQKVNRGTSMKGHNQPRYLTEAQLSQLIKAARKGRHGQRDSTLILIMARDGLRVTEAIDLHWDQVDFAKGHLHVRRLKNGIDSVHTIQGDELRALRELRRNQDPQSAFVFTSERGGPMTRSNVAKMIEAAGDRAGLPQLHPHMLRHTCGHLLADAGHDTRRLQLWLGHSDIKHTAAYSQLSARPFRDFWR